MRYQLTIETDNPDEIQRALGAITGTSYGDNASVTVAQEAPAKGRGSRKPKETPAQEQVQQPTAFTPTPQPGFAPPQFQPAAPQPGFAPPQFQPAAPQPGFMPQMQQIPGQFTSPPQQGFAPPAAPPQGSPPATQEEAFGLLQALIHPTRLGGQGVMELLMRDFGVQGVGGLDQDKLTAVRDRLRQELAKYPS